MKNLKKVLALVMAFATAFTVMAGAAFTDAADIKTTEAVDTLVALGVINGNPDGSFKPDATVTRAEMAKMIYVLRTGKDDASAYASSATTFTDINGHWAAGFIKYCQSLGIIAGKSATVFDPDNTVTGTEAAKMLLVTLGYDAEKAGLVGTGWDKKTIALADENGLLADVDAPLALALPRQYAAQIIFNTVDAPTVKLTDGEYSNINILGTEYPTVGEKYMNLKKSIGTLNSVVKTDGKTTYEISLTMSTENESDSTSPYVTAFKSVAKDYSSLKYQQVKVLYKDKDTVYGVYATTDNASYTGLLGNLKMDGSKIKLEGTSYSVDDSNAVYVDGYQLYRKATGTGTAGALVAADFGAQSTTYTVAATITEFVTANAEGNATYGKGSNVTALSTDGNTKIDTLRVTTYSVAKVTYVGSDYINASGVKKDDDYNYPSDLKKDDYVVISAAGNYADDKGLITKADTVEGKVTATKGTDKVTINDTWYTMNPGVSAPNLNATVKLILVNGFAYDKTTVTAGTSDIALVAEVAQSSGVGSVWQARLIFADGTDKVVTLDEIDGATPTPSALSAAFMATYSVSKDKYDLTTISGSELAGYTNLVTGGAATIDGKATGGTMTDDTSASVSALYFNTSAAVFVRYKTDDFKVVTGSDVKNWKSTTVTGIAALTDTDSGNTYAKVAYIDLGAASVPGGSDKTYAVALDSSYTKTISGTTYTMVEAWNGTATDTYKIDGTVSFTKGDAFEYSIDSEGIADVTKLATSGTDSLYTTAKVTSYDEGTGDIVLSVAALSDSVVDSDDTVVLYIDSDDDAGVGSGEIQVAEDTDGDGTTEMNVIAYSEAGEDQITLLIVDVNNNMKYSKS